MTNLGPGWNLSPEGIKIISEDGTIKDKSKMLKNALDSDLKEIGNPALSEQLSKSRISSIVLQIQKIRNIAAPKANEGSQAAPRMLKLVLTDGVSYVQAIELSTIPSISRDKTAPGTKILIDGAKLLSGFLLISSSTCTLLGGKVAALYEKWETAKSIQISMRRSVHTDGAPAWVNFGTKISTSQDRQFKSLDNKKEGKENSEFDQLRQGAIAEVSSGAIRKVFGGGGVKQTVQNQNNNPGSKRFNNDGNHRERNFKGQKTKTFENEIDEKPQKPSERVSLFDFLEDKLPVSEVANTSISKTNTPPYSNNYNNNKFATNRQSNFQPRNQKNYSQNYPRGPTPQNFNKRENKNFNVSQQNFAYQNEPKQYQSQNNDFQENYSDSRTKYDNKSTNSAVKYSDNRNYNKQFPPRQNVTESKIINSQPNVVQPNQLNNVSSLTNNLNRMSLNTNSNFASRTLRQHLNLTPQKNLPNYNTNTASGSTNVIPNAWNWNNGDECLAKYWEDGKYYNAIITAVTDKTCVVKFKGYGNMEEILKVDCLPITTAKQEANFNFADQTNRSFGGPMEFRRSAKSYNNRQ